MTTRCHSVRSLRSPVALSRQFSDVAILRFTMAFPSWVWRTSGSFPKLPTRITLLTEPAILSLHFPGHPRPLGQGFHPPPQFIHTVYMFYFCSKQGKKQPRHVAGAV